MPGAGNSRPPRRSDGGPTILRPARIDPDLYPDLVFSRGRNWDRTSDPSLVRGNADVQYRPMPAREGPCGSMRRRHIPALLQMLSSVVMRRRATRATGSAWATIFAVLAASSRSGTFSWRYLAGCPGERSATRTWHPCLPLAAAHASTAVLAGAGIERTLLPRPAGLARRRIAAACARPEGGARASVISYEATRQVFADREPGSCWFGCFGAGSGGGYAGVPS